MKETSICRRDVSGQVVEQNAACTRICGNREGVICKDNCVEHVDFAATLANKKTKLVNGRMIGEQAYDIVISPYATGATTLLLEVERPKQSDFMQALRDYALTKRELVVAKMIGQGFTNREISAKLYISLATVKTHINRIYSKLGINAGMLSEWRLS